MTRARTWAGTATTVAKTLVVLLALLQLLQLLGVTRVELARADTRTEVVGAPAVTDKPRKATSRPASIPAAPKPGRALTAAQIAALARQAGFRGGDLTTAVAVALAESGGRADAVGDVTLQTGTWGPSIGLLQIRSLREQRGSGGLRDELANRDPLTNLRHGLQLARTERGWRHWSTVLHGSYRRFLPQARALPD